MDLSWPIEGPSINSGIPKDSFLGAPTNLRYPTLDDLCKRAAQLRNVSDLPLYGWRKDMERAFKQLPLDPSSWSELGFYWQGALLFEKTAVMGCRSAPMACQKSTNFIRHVMQNIDYVIYNYIDDFMSIDFYQRACSSYSTLGNLLRDLGVNEAEDKAVPPSQILEFLGIIYNFITMMISIPQEKLQEIKQELRSWSHRQVMTKKQLQQITGKLQFAAACIHLGRVFINRLYDIIATLGDTGRFHVNKQVRKDLLWWRHFLDKYNGASMMWLVQKTVVNELIATDACLVGAGGFSEGDYYKIKFPTWVLNNPEGPVYIAHLEMLAIIIAVRLWKQKIRGKKFVVGSDSQVVVTVINSGRSRNELLQAMLRELTYQLVMVNAELHAKFIPGTLNEIPDLLSRWHLDSKYQQEFHKKCQEHWTQCEVDEKLMEISSYW